MGPIGCIKQFIGDVQVCFEVRNSNFLKSDVCFEVGYLFSMSEFWLRNMQTNILFRDCFGLREALGTAWIHTANIYQNCYSSKLAAGRWGEILRVEKYICLPYRQLIEIMNQFQNS